LLVQAGLDGVRQHMDIEARPRPLPGSLSEALTLLQESRSAAEWLGPELHSAYIAFKRAEIKSLDQLEESEICRRYAEVY
jgi:glutamine synthetase